MTKAELLALGLPEENIKEFQNIYHRDLRKAAQRMMDDPERGADELRRAIIPMVSTIKNTDSLRRILANVTHHYLKDYRDEEDAKRAAPVLEHQDGQADPKDSKINESALIVPGGERDCQV